MSRPLLGTRVRVQPVHQAVAVHGDVGGLQGGRRAVLPVGGGGEGAAVLDEVGREKAVVVADEGGPGGKVGEQAEAQGEEEEGEEGEEQEWEWEGQ